MEISKERLEEFKKIYKKEYDKDISNKEAYEAALNLTNFVKLIYDCWVDEQEWKKRLEKEPKGVQISGSGRTCFVCKEGIPEGSAWYNQYGVMCPHCQKATEKNQIPKFILKDIDSTYKEWQIQDKLGIRHQTITKMIKEGKLKARVIKTMDGKGIHCRLFPKKENSGLFAVKNNC